VAQREGHKVALQAVIAAHRAVLRHDEQLLVVGPAQALDRALIPLLPWSAEVLVQTCAMRGGRAYVDAPDQLPCAAVHVDARLGRAGAAVRVQLLLIAKDGWHVLLALRAPTHQEAAAYPPTAPLYGAPTTLYLSSSRSWSKTAV
jgi:hypothetical protein